ncbi:hypothetical protein [Deinococcus sp.]|uniref:hypothetical protein n=1 Tax=Deinococcus sp. TaxID=47478 RepID=UPI0025E0EA53|nr:hypothetical protein [Deinococcus sp.]
MTSREALITYIKDIRKVHGSGTPENTYLPLLKPLFEGLLPEYEVITHPSKDQQGLPDFALREPGGAENIALGEAEALDLPLSSNAHGLQQAQGYAKQAPTLLTNFHEFVVLDGSTELGRYTIAHADLTGHDLKPAALADRHLAELSSPLNVWASARGTLRRPLCGQFWVIFIEKNTVPEVGFPIYLYFNSQNLKPISNSQNLKPISPSSQM